MKRLFIYCFLVVWVFLAAAPAMAGVSITIDNSVYPFEVRYSRTQDVPRVKAFALDIRTDNGTSIITDVNSFSPHYPVAPGSIISSDGIREGSPVADSSYANTLGGIDTNGVTIEMASLYKGQVNAPPDAGLLCRFTVDSDCTVSITENIRRGGVVLEDANRASTLAALDLGGATAVPLDAPSSECYEGQPDYAQWEMAGKPICWCYPRQCYGDADGLKQGNPLGGYYYVGPDDLAIIVPAWMVREPPKGPGISAAQACGDYSRTTEGNPLGGYYRVGPGDIAIMVSTWMVKEPPNGDGIPADCLPGNETPPP